MKVVKYILAVLFFLIALGYLFSGSFLSFIFSTILGLSFLPDVSKKLSTKYKIWDTKLFRYCSYILLFIMIGLFADELNLNTSSSTSKKSYDEQQEVVAEIQPIKDSLDTVLKKYDLSVCQVYKDVSALELKSIKDADKKYPNFGKKHLEYSENLRVKRTNQYQKEKGLSKELFDNAILYSDECSEKEILENVNKVKEEKQLQTQKKEKIEDCFINACSLTRRKIKRIMHNPKSFKYVDCKYLGAGESTFTIRYSYRGQNKLGATVLESVKAEIDIEKCEVIKIK